MRTGGGVDRIDLDQLLYRNEVFSRAIRGLGKVCGLFFRKELTVIVFIAGVFALRAPAQRVNVESFVRVRPLEGSENARESLLSVEDKILARGIGLGFKIKSLGKLRVHVARQSSEPLHRGCPPQHYRAYGKPTQQTVNQLVDSIRLPHKWSLHGRKDNLVMFNLGQKTEERRIKHFATPSGRGNENHSLPQRLVQRRAADV